MAKAYLVYTSWGRCDDSSVVGVFLDESKADEYIKEKNKAYEEEMKNNEKCSKCRCENYEHEDENIFLYRSSCEKAEIKEDRYGEYCENDDSEYYQSVTSDEYWKKETDILE